MDNDVYAKALRREANVTNLDILPQIERSENVAIREL